MTDTAQDIIDRLNRRLIRDASIYPGTTTITEQEIKVLADALRCPAAPTEWELEREDLQYEYDCLEKQFEAVYEELREANKRLEDIINERKD